MIISYRDQSLVIFTVHTVYQKLLKTLRKSYLNHLYEYSDNAYVTIALRLRAKLLFLSNSFPEDGWVLFE